MNLYDANKQWAERPADERFWTLDEMQAACEAHSKKTMVDTIDFSEVGVEVSGQEIALRNRTKRLIPTWESAALTHWSFGAICSRLKAPAMYLRTLPVQIAVASLEFGLTSRPKDSHRLLLYQNGSTRVLGITSDTYVRIWNWQIVRKLRALVDEQPGWRLPPARPAYQNQPGARPATEADCLRSTGALSVKIGDPIAPAGLYASDHDCFAFLVNESNWIKDGTDRGLSRGIFISNSEVGASSFKLVTFLYRHVCGNHIVWGAKSVDELRIRHVGRARDRVFDELSTKLKHYANESPRETEAMIARARKREIASSEDELLEKVSPRFVTRRQGEEAYQLALAHADEDGSPLTAWGFAQGLTRLSQEVGFADKRVELDTAAGKVIQMAL